MSDQQPTPHDTEPEQHAEPEAADGGQPGQPEQPAGPPATKTGLNRPWLIKVVLMTVAVFAFGSWGLLDALVIYPNRGREHALYAEYEYLRSAQEADRKEDPGLFRRSEEPGRLGVSLPDPAAELAELRERETRDRVDQDAADQDSPRHFRALMQQRRLEWLIALSRVGQLTPEQTSFEAPRDRLEELEAEWATKARPTPLHSYDIPTQWLIVVVCYGFGVYLLYLFFSVASKTYRWDPNEKTLTLPGGTTIAPEDLEDVDKRKWDKFIVYLKLRQEHPSLGGQNVKFDTYRYAHLEDWILEMEEAADLPDDDEPHDEDEPQPVVAPEDQAPSSGAAASQA